MRVRPLNEFLFGWTREPLLTLRGGRRAGAADRLRQCRGAAAVARVGPPARGRAARGTRRRARPHHPAVAHRERAARDRRRRAAGSSSRCSASARCSRMTTPPGSPPLTAIGLNCTCHRAAGPAHDRHRTRVRPGAGDSRLASRSDRLAQGAGPSRGAGSPRTFPQGVLVSVQLALALVLLIGSGLLLNSLVRQVRRDLNFDPDGLVRARFRRARGSLRAAASARISGFPYFEIAPPPSQTLERVLERLRAVPGAESVAGISAPPVDSFVLATMEVTLEGQSPATMRRRAARHGQRHVLSGDAESVSDASHADRARTRLHRSRHRRHAVGRDRQRNVRATILAGRGSHRQATHARHGARRTAARGDRRRARHSDEARRRSAAGDLRVVPAAAVALPRALGRPVRADAVHDPAGGRSTGDRPGRAKGDRRNRSRPAAREREHDASRTCARAPASFDRSCGWSASLRRLPHCSPRSAPTASWRTR